MSSRKLLVVLAASVTLNAALLALIVARAPSAFHRADAEGSRALPAAPPVSALPSAPQVAAVFASLDKGGDLKSFIDRLRAAGVPHSILRAIAEAKVNDLLFARRAVVAKTYVVTQPYWSTKFQEPNPKLWNEMRAIGKEQGAMLKDALGPDAPQPDEGPIMKALAQSRSGGIPLENINRMNAIVADYNELKSDVMASSNGIWTPEERDKMAYLDKEQKADMAKALSPEDYFEYQLRNSATAGMLRNNLSAFNPTEEEFRAIFKANQDFNEQYGDPASQMTSDQQRERQAHQADLSASIQQVLGADRYADYSVETDQTYVIAARFVDKLGLPASATQQLVSVENDVGKRADAVRRDPTLSDADRASQLSALNDEATSKLSAVLGDSGLAAYRLNGGGWLQGLKPQGK